MLLKLIVVGIALAPSGLFGKECSATSQDSPKGSRRSGIENSDVLGVLPALGWTTVTLVTDRVEQECGLTLDGLQAQGIQVMIAESNISVIPFERIAGDTYDTQGRFLVKGNFSFVEQVFQQVADHVTSIYRQDLLFFTKWLTVINQGDTNLLEKAVSRFENVAAVVRYTKGGSTLWTMKRTGDMTELTLVTSLPARSILTPRHIFPNPAHKLGGRTLKVVVKQRSYFVMQTAEGFEGVVIDLLKELSTRLNFSYTLEEPHDQSWGQRLDDGSWDGAIGMLTRKEVDLAASSFSETPDRSSVADATTAFFYDNARLMFRRAQPRADPWTFFLQPFELSVYLTIAAVFVGVQLLLLCFERCHRKTWDADVQDVTSETTCKCVCWFWRVIDETESLLAALINRPFEKEDRARAGRVLMCSWLLLSVLLASCYGSGLTANLTVKDQAPGFTSMGELVQQDSYTWGIADGTAKSSILSESENQVHQTFYQGVLRFAQSDPSVLSPDLDVQKQKVFTENYVFFTGSSDLYEAWHAENCDVTMLSEAYFKTSKVFYLQKGSPYTKMISEEIGRIFEAGLMTYWERKWSPDKKQCAIAERQSSHVKTRLVDIQSAFWLIGFGVGAAILVLGLEVLVDIARRRVRSRRRKLVISQGVSDVELCDMREETQT